MEEITEKEIDYIDLLKKIKKNWILIMVITISVVIATFIISTVTFEQRYEANMKVIAVKDNTMDTGLIDMNNYSNPMATFIGIARTNSVAENAALKFGEMDSDEYTEALNVELDDGTMIINFNIISEKPSYAYLGIQAYQTAFIEVANQYYPEWKFTVIERPIFPEEPIKQNIYRNLTIAFTVGLMGSVTFSILLEYYKSNKYKMK